MTKVPFNVDAYTARLIGRENVSKLEGAVVELIKQIRDIRVKYNISQSDLCVLLGWGAKTITRYESHQVQDKAHDTILKKIDQDPEWFLSLLNDVKSNLSIESYQKYLQAATSLYEEDRDIYLRKCLQMNPVVRPLITVVEKENKKFVSAEIPGIDLADRPCYYQGRGRLKGSYTRIGDSDEPMTEYEIYSYEVYRRKYQDDIREVPRVTLMSLDQEELNRYVELLKRGKQRLATLDNESIYELMSIKRGEKVTLNATLLFSPYPQAYFPQLCITAIVIPGRTIGSLGDMGERFSDNQRIEGTIPEMLDEALLFVKRNMRTKTIISPTTGRRTDRTDYPITAVREAIINALVHRDYSIHTEGMPIQLIMFEDRIEIHNPGGLYGRITIDQLGKIQPDTRNPVLASALETLGIIENRYSGIPTIRMEMEKYNLRQPEFLDERGSFIVKLYKESKNDYEDMSNDEETNNLIVFCKTPRTRKEICDYLGLNSVTYAIQTYVNPLVEAGVIKLSIPDKPKSPKQLYYSGEREK